MSSKESWEITSPISPLMFKKIKEEEGFIAIPSPDPLGFLTIGYGTNLTIPLSEKEGEILLAIRLNKVAEALKGLDWFNDLDAPRQEAIINMAYNIGFNGVLEFREMIEAIRNKNWPVASSAMLNSKWANQVKDRAKYLASVMLTGNI